MPQLPRAYPSSIRQLNVFYHSTVVHGVYRKVPCPVAVPAVSTPRDAPRPCVAVPAYGAASGPSQPVFAAPRSPSSPARRSRPGDRPGSGKPSLRAVVRAANPPRIPQARGKRLLRSEWRVPEPSRWSLLSNSSRSRKSRVVGRSNTAFTRNARASGTRSLAGRPGARSERRNFSTRTNSKTWMRCSYRSPGAPGSTSDASCSSA